jgi:hypothetical protein
MRGVKDNGINKNVPGRFIIMQTVNVRKPSLQPMIFIPHKKMHLKRELKLGSTNKKDSNLSFLDI